MASAQPDGSALTLDELLVHFLDLKEREPRAWSCFIVGRMGSGKTQLLHLFAQQLGLRTDPSQAQIQSRLQAQSNLALISAIVSALSCTPQEAADLLSRSGLNTVPSWLTPWRLLSGGEQARVLTALQLHHGVQILDNFGCCLDEQSANMAALAAQRLLPRDKAVFFATQSPKLVRFAQPDYVVWISEAGIRGQEQKQRRFHFIKNVNPSGERRPTVSLCLDARAFDVEPAPRFPRSIRGGGQLMAPGPLRALRSQVRCDDATAYVSQCTQLEFSGEIKREFVELPISRLDAKDWKLGVIWGPSGCGKTMTQRRLLRLSTLPDATWARRSVIAVLGGDDRARKRARAAGLTRADWERQYYELSAGEQAAACIAHALQPFDDNARCVVAVDEAFSYHDPESARRCAHRLRHFLSTEGRRTQLVLAGAAIDEPLLAILQPDWIFNPSKPAGAPDALRVFQGRLDPPTDVVVSASVLPPSPTELFRRFAFSGTARRCKHDDWRNAWDMVKRFHYLSTVFPRNSTYNIFMLRCNATLELVGFVAYGAFFGLRSSTDPRKLYQERRLVVPSAWQGMKLGPKLSEALGAFITGGGATDGAPARYSSVTANKALGTQRSASGLWKANAINAKMSTGGAHGAKTKKRYVQYSHEYIGRAGAGGGGAAAASVSRSAPPPSAPQPSAGAAGGWRAPPPGPPASKPRAPSSAAAGGWRPPPSPPLSGRKRERDAVPAPAPAPARGINSMLSQLAHAKKPRPDSSWSGPTAAAPVPRAAAPPMPPPARSRAAPPEVIVIDDGGGGRRSRVVDAVIVIDDDEVQLIEDDDDDDDDSDECIDLT